MPSPMPPQQGSPQGAPSPQSSPPQQGGGVQKFLETLDQGIDQLNQLVQSSKATNPQEKQMIAQIDQLFGKFMQSIGQGESPQDEAGEQDPAGGGGQGQTVPQEAGGNKGAIPA